MCTLGWEKKLSTFEDLLWKISGDFNQVTYSFFKDIYWVCTICRMYSSEFKCIRTTWDRICQRKEKTSAGCLQIALGARRLLMSKPRLEPICSARSRTFPRVPCCHKWFQLVFHSKEGQVPLEFNVFLIIC